MSDIDSEKKDTLRVKLNKKNSDILDLKHVKLNVNSKRILKRFFIFRIMVSVAERLNQSKIAKAEKRRLQKVITYQNNKQQYNETKKTKRHTDKSDEKSKDAKRKMVYRLKLKDKKEKFRTYMANYSKHIKERITEDETDIKSFNNRMEKSRAIKKLKTALPKSPMTRAAVLSSYIDEKREPFSPAVRSVRKLSFGNIANAALSDIKTVIQNVKSQRNDDARSTMNVLTASLNGENVQKKRGVKKLAGILGVKPRTLTGGRKIRAKVLQTEKSSWTYIMRKTRSDAISDEVKDLAYKFWLNPENSRPACNKNDTKRARIGPNLYSKHMSYVLEKTQTEIYNDFRTEYPDIKISQRVFENCMPYFVRPVKPKDKLTCCCRYHIEMRTVFKACMKFRRSVIKSKPVSNEHVTVYDTIDELISDTLCAKPENEKYHKLSCLSRNCDQCGTCLLNLMQEEMDESENAPNIIWEKYEYREIKCKNNTRKKLVLVQKESKPKEVFEYLRHLLETFPLHQFRSLWQNKQRKHIAENLPKDHCLLIHDFSENYRCIEKQEIQSSYFQKTEISIHVSLIYRHAILEYDGIDSTQDNPNIVCEQFFVFSDDETHDYHFTHAAQQLINEYLKSISYNVKVMHEFTDGCSTQYKSRHCMGDFSFGCRDFGYKEAIRNYFEPSHAKGPQDAAGGYIKHQADLSVIRGKSVIQSADDLYKFAEKHLSNPGTNAICKRRIFRLLKSVNRERERYFKPVPDNRQIRQIRTCQNGKLSVRKLSCYTCSKCEDE